MIIIILLSVLIQQIYSATNLKFGVFFDIIFIMVFAIHTCSYMLGLSYLAKICGDKIRGTMFGFNGIIGSVGVTIMNGTGGPIYHNISKAAPFGIALIGYIILAILIPILDYLNLLKL